MIQLEEMYSISPPSRAYEYLSTYVLNGTNKTSQDLPYSPIKGIKTHTLDQPFSSFLIILFFGEYHAIPKLISL